MRRAYAPIPKAANKYSRGSVLVIGGSPEFEGAPLLAAEAALRTRSGYVTIAAPLPIIAAISAANPVFVYKPLIGDLESDMKTISSAKFDSVVVGPGMAGGSQALFDSFASLMKHGKVPVVVDAGALRLAKNAKLSKNFVLTPHDGEFKKLTGIDLKGKSVQVRAREAVKFAASNKCVLVLKGHETIVTDGMRVKVNIAKSPALATMGTGDVLDGIIASLAASHRNMFDCAVAGVYLHSLIGDTLYKGKGAHITAQDVIDGIPDALKGFDITR